MASGLFNLKQVNQAISQGAWSGYIAPRWVEYLVVAGGGGGGGFYGGGGGAGGLLTGIVTVAAGTSYSVTIGTGGAGATSGGARGSSGVSSVFGSISSTGGGAGGADGVTALSGGSGGGAITPQNIGSGTSGQGNAGGSGFSGGSTTTTGGGGGGAGTVGLTTGVASLAGNGGAGIASAITGTVVTYAGGGGGGTGNNLAGGSGGVGGGGVGGDARTAGAVNTGGGGGGGCNSTQSTGGAGGSGIVVVRYPGNVQFYTGGTVTYSNGYIVHNFTANGTLAPTTPTVVSEYQISRSLRFNSADSTNLDRAFSGAGSQTTFTLSVWLKRSKLSGGSRVPIWASGASGTNAFDIYFGAADELYVEEYNVATNYYVQTSQLFRDPSAWYHIVVAIDTTQATSSNRIKVYVNGVQVTAFAAANYPTQNFAYQINTTAYYGRFGQGIQYSANFFNGYMTEINFIDGQQLTSTSFGYVNPTTGVWSPAKFVGGYSTNGFYLNFSDNSNTTAATLGADLSGNGNNYTPYNFSVTAGAGNDSLVDSPTSYGTDTGVGGTVRGNYSTLNPLNLGASATLANGNLDHASTSGSWTTALSTIGMTSGQWYFEATITSSGNHMVGIANQSFTTSAYLGENVNSWGYYSSGEKYTGVTSGTAYGASYTNGDVIGAALDMDAGTIVFYKNGSSQGTAFSGLTGPLFFGVSGISSTTRVVNFGQRPFANTAPSGFKALCTQNLPTPTIGATSATLAGKYFAPVLYTGTGASQSITGVGFQPDWVWVKSRSAATDHALYDAVRGVQKQLESNTTDAETTQTTGLTAFGSDGFTVGALAQMNTSAATYVSWNWKANGAGSTNTAGTITSTVSVSTASGFSVLTYIANGTNNATIGHGLGTTPVFAIVMRRDAVHHSRIGTSVTASSSSPATGYLSTNSAFDYGSGLFNSFNSTTITVGTSGDINTNGSYYVMYCFAAVAGYSAFGSYTGNASTDGTFVFTGFRPAYVMIKSSSAATDWIVYDAVRNTYNVTNLNLRPNTSDAESSQAANYIDLLSNGFKLRGDGSGSINASGATYFYMAFASNPFKYSLAR
jgi:hypothetical protein